MGGASFLNRRIRPLGLIGPIGSIGPIYFFVTRTAVLPMDRSS